MNPMRVCRWDHPLLPAPRPAASGSVVSLPGRSMAPADEASFSRAMRAAQDGDAAAYRALLRDCVPVIAAAARAKGVRGALVDDVVQETLLTLHRARATYDPARPFLPWLRAIAQRRAIDALRRRLRDAREVHDPSACEAQADEGPLPGEDLDRSERARLLRSAVTRLPRGQQEAIESIALRELSLEEASNLTGRTKGALKVNFHRALKALRSSLSSGRKDLDV